MFGNYHVLAETATLMRKVFKKGHSSARTVYWACQSASATSVLGVGTEYDLHAGVAG